MNKITILLKIIISTIISLFITSGINSFIYELLYYLQEDKKLAPFAFIFKFCKLQFVTGRLIEGTQAHLYFFRSPAAEVCSGIVSEYYATFLSIVLFISVFIAVYLAINKIARRFKKN